MSPPRLTANKIDQFVGSRIRAKRQRMRISESELAEAVGVPVQTIKDYEEGRLRVPAAHLVTISGILQASLEDFFAFSVFAPRSGRPNDCLH
jgi:transcriptional regulator with XRE-family HTH domain